MILNLSKKTLFFFIVTILNFNLTAQGPQKDTTNYSKYSNFNIEMGTVLIYSSITLNYESENVLQSNIHFLKFEFGGGLWAASMFNSNQGFLTNANAIYLYGENAHHFEANLGAAIHFSKKNGSDEVTYQNTIPNLFLGYRYQKKGEKMMFKAGIGAIKLFQIGIGYSIE